MKQRASSLVIVLLSLAALVGFTSAIKSSDLAGAHQAGLAPGGTFGSESPASAGHGTGGTGGAAGPGALAGAAGTGTVAGAGGSAGSPGAVAGNAGPASDSAPGGPTTGRPLKVAYLIPDLAGLASVVGPSTYQPQSDDADRADREFWAMFDDLNAGGGIAGRKVEARGYRYNVQQLADESTLLQSCVSISEDYGASYVIDTYVMPYPSVQQCFAQHHVVLITLAATLDERTLHQFAPYVATTYPTIDRQFTALAPRLQELGYLKGAKVGVLLDDNPAVDAPYSRILEPALTRAGAKPVAVARAGQTDSAAQSSAVLKFRSAGVTHVIFVAGIVQFLGFSNAAESQGYRPRYAFSDYQSVPAAAASLGNASQLTNAVAVSSCDSYACVTDDARRSSTDMATPYDRSKLSPGFRRCLDTLSRVRKTDYYKPGEAGASSVFNDVCDHFLLWTDALRSAGTAEPARFGVALASLGPRYPSTVIHATDFGDGRQSGALQFAGGVFNGNCQCYVRQTPWTAVR